ncbi:hypothetical protein D3C78_1655600 [compost metagenome]
MPARQLTENPLKRYLINSPMLPGLKRDADGGVTLYVQHQRPGAGHESNWLPVPAGPFMVVMRLYWPEPAVGNGTWKRPELVRVD